MGNQPHRTPTSGTEVIQVVEAAFTALRVERNEARELLADVLNDAGPQLSLALVQRITRVLDAP